jgi:hypothetical protein
MAHVIVNCYLEGMLTPGTFFCLYPGSKVGTASTQIAEYARPAASIIHGFYRSDLLQRVVDAPDTSLERVAARREYRTPNVSIATQAKTVTVGPDYRYKLRGRRVVVFDDFTTKGMSLDWARTLLLTAGAAEVVLVTIGKYGGTYTQYIPRVAIDPFEHHDYSASDFDMVSHQLGISLDAEECVRAACESLL